MVECFLPLSLDEANDAFVALRVQYDLAFRACFPCAHEHMQLRGPLDLDLCERSEREVGEPFSARRAHCVRVTGGFIIAHAACFKSLHLSFSNWILELVPFIERAADLTELVFTRLAYGVLIQTLEVEAEFAGAAARMLAPLGASIQSLRLWVEPCRSSSLILVRAVHASLVSLVHLVSFGLGLRPASEADRALLAADVSLIGDTLRCAPRLTELNLTLLPLSLAGARELAQAMGTLPGMQMRKLRLDQTGLGDKAAHVIIESILSHVHGLKYLSLASCNLRNPILLATLISSHRYLERLCLANNDALATSACDAIALALLACGLIECILPQLLESRPLDLWPAVRLTSTLCQRVCQWNAFRFGGVWTAERHSLFPVAIREAVLTILLASQTSALPRPLRRALELAFTRGRLFELLGASSAHDWVPAKGFADLDGAVDAANAIRAELAFVGAPRDVRPADPRYRALPRDVVPQVTRRRSCSIVLWRWPLVLDEDRSCNSTDAKRLATLHGILL